MKSRAIYHYPNRQHSAYNAHSTMHRFLHFFFVFHANTTKDARLHTFTHSNLNAYQCENAYFFVDVHFSLKTMPNEGFALWC